MKELKCLVIGGSSGIGLECVKYLCARNSKIIVVSRSNFELASDSVLNNICNSKVEHYKVDITNDKEIEKLANLIFKKFGALDLLINCAGIGFYKNLVQASFLEITKVIDTNLTAPIKVFNKFIPLMNKEASATIVQLGSYAGLKKGHKLFSVYSAAKSGLLGFFNSLSVEYAETKINIFLVYMPGVKTDFFVKSIGGAQFDQKAKLSELESPSKMVKVMFKKIRECRISKKYIIKL